MLRCESVILNAATFGELLMFFYYYYYLLGNKTTMKVTRVGLTVIAKLN